MRANELRHRIAIQTSTEEANEFNEDISSWETDDTIWAKVEPLNGRELSYHQQQIGEVTHKITLRYHEGLSPQQRFLFGARIFEIASVRNIEERNIEMEAIAKEVV